MQHNKYLVLGQMSGTSLDGQDFVLAHFWKVSGQWKYKVLAAKTFPYPEDFVDRLKLAHQLSSAALGELNSAYGDITQLQLQEFLAEHPNFQPDLLSFHGHTVRHKPEKGITYQLGTWQQWADIFQMPLVGEFRKPDVALGGQGAPLVPGGDIHLFQTYDYTLNLGGFANVTDLTLPTPIAYDLCAVNVVLNQWANTLGLPFDAGGALAARGTLLPDLFAELNRLAFYQQKPPKSLGREWVVNAIEPLVAAYLHHDIRDLLHTYCCHVSSQIGQIFPTDKKVLVTGGGAKNHFLMEQLQKQTTASIERGDTTLVDYKEAMIFAFLGLLCHEGQVNCWASVTGASKNHTTGIVFFPRL
ncbi:MAG: anhydro-N-acetylmuramic acid kinase [Flavobacteriaceae bacterium]